MKRIYFLRIVLAIILMVSLVSCGNQDADTDAETETLTDVEDQQQTSEEEQELQQNKNPIVTITMENGDVMVAELYPDIAPNTVKNFIYLINSKFYDGVIFHRVIPGFMIQGGDPTGTGMGGPDYSIKGEFTSNGFNNELQHVAGVLSMARSQQNDSAGSQFFIMVEEAPHLDGSYAAFGKLTQGLDVAVKISGVERNNQDKPKQDQKIKSITVDTFGVDYGEPDKV